MPDYEPRKPTKSVQKAMPGMRPVAAGCLAYALAHATVGRYAYRDLGINGGITTWQRRQLQAGQSSLSSSI